jgi:hypothetical protein
MAEALEVERAAKLLIDQHGGRALANALIKIAHFQSDGDDSAAALWVRIAEAIIKLQRRSDVGN